MATQSSILAWRTPMGRAAWGATVHRVMHTQADTTEAIEHACTYAGSSKRAL